ncbi:MAG: DUF2169 domain-containing protein [Myxococcota bacterium]
MHVASFSPLSVGGISWRSPEPTYSVVLKATFSLEHDGPLRWHLQQTPVGDDEIGGCDGELYYGGDFAPRKVGVDVMMVGHARAAEPATVLPFALQIGAVRHVLQAVSESPVREVPLWSRHVMRVTRDARQTVQLAPRPTESRRWLREVPTGFDFGVFNAASPDLRLDDVPVDARLRLEGLLRGAPVRSVILHDLQPYVFYVHDAHHRAGADLLYPACDTLWIDTDRERLIMTWRCELKAAHPNPFLVVVLGGRRHAPDWSEVRPQLGRARWHDAHEPPPVRWPTGSMAAVPELLTAPAATPSATGTPALPPVALGSQPTAGGAYPAPGAWPDEVVPPPTPSWTPPPEEVAAPPTPRQPPTPTPSPTEAGTAPPPGAAPPPRPPRRQRYTEPLLDGIAPSSAGGGGRGGTDTPVSTGRTDVGGPPTPVVAHEHEGEGSRETLAYGNPAPSPPPPSVDLDDATEAIELPPPSERTAPSLVIEPAERDDGGG